MTTPSKHTFRKRLITGVLILIPIGITVWVLQFLVKKIQSVARPLVLATAELIGFENIPPWAITLVSLAVVVLFVFFIGWLANFYVGKKVLDYMDRLMLGLPLIRTIYGGAKQIIDAFSLQASGSFKKVVLLEYPRRDSWVLGFVTNESLEDAQHLFHKDLVAVFVPSTPNPTTGFLLYLDPFDIYLVDLEVDEAVKLIVSAGLVVPPLEKTGPVTLGESLGLERKSKRGDRSEDLTPAV